MSAVLREDIVATPKSFGADVIVHAVGLAKYFDVSPPWLNRVLENKSRAILHAVDGVSFVTFDSVGTIFGSQIN